MPGKIAVPRIATVDIVASNSIGIRLDDTRYQGSEIHCEFEDNPDNKEHLLELGSGFSKVFIENLDVTHLVIENKLVFTTPIYKWLFANLDNK